jgi:hypothetical protein
LIGADDWGLTCEILKKLVKSVCYKPKAGLSQKLLIKIAAFLQNSKNWPNLVRAKGGDW